MNHFSWEVTERWKVQYTYSGTSNSARYTAVIMTLMDSGQHRPNGKPISAPSGYSLQGWTVPRTRLISAPRRLLNRVVVQMPVFIDVPIGMGHGQSDIERTCTRNGQCWVSLPDDTHPGPVWLIISLPMGKQKTPNDGQEHLGREAEDYRVVLDKQVADD